MAAAGFRHPKDRPVPTDIRPGRPVHQGQSPDGAHRCVGAELSWISIGYSGGGENRQDGQGGGGLSGGAGIVHRRVADATRQGSQLNRPQHRDEGIGHGQRRQGREIECRQMFNHKVLLILPEACSCSGVFFDASLRTRKNVTQI